MAAKAVVRDSGRVLGFPYGLVDGVSKLIPNILGIGLKDALGRGKEGPDSEMASPELIARYQNEEDVRDLIDLALQLEDLTRNAGKHGQEEIIYPDPRTEAILKDTYGIMVYQEQVMQMAQIVGGYSLGGADLLRRAMGKKVPAEMAKHREIFREGAAKGGVDGPKADEIFDLMEKFAGYGFNKSHAAAYALVSYQTAWLKCHYPAEFMAATLSSDMDNTDKVVGFLAEVDQLGLTVLPPKVNASAFMFQASDARTIRYGLGAIKGVGQGACEAVVAERERAGTYRSLLDFCTRCESAKLNRRTLEAMINAGALDDLGPNRASLTLQLPEVLKATDQLARERASGQVSLFGAPDPVSTAAQLDLPECAEWPLGQLLAAERDTLGFYLSGHPFDTHAADVRDLVPNDLGGLENLIAPARPARDGEKRAWRAESPVVLAGLVTGVRRKGDSQVFVTLEDGRGKVECSTFSDGIAEFGHLLIKDRVLVVKGGLREDEFNGGYALRLRQCWDFEQVCRDYAARMQLRADLRQADSWPRISALLAAARPGRTPLRLDLIVGDEHSAVAGMLDLPAAGAVTVSPTLLQQLRSDPAIVKLQVRYSPPWQQ
jgi:DNA polymerase-3 subunit alpha